MWGFILNKMKLYPNIWRLILRQLPEPFWCKLYLNHSFLELLKSEHSTGTVRELSLMGKLESLKNMTVDFESLCKSNVHAVRRYCHKSKTVNFSIGLYYSYYANKMDIFEYFAKSSQIPFTIKADSIITGKIKSLTNERFDNLELCFNDKYIVLDDGQENSFYEIGSMDGIEHVLRQGAVKCHCGKPRDHSIRGVRGPVGPIGPSSHCRSDYEPVSRYREKIKKRSWVTKKKR